VAVAAGHAGTHLKSAPGNGCIQWVHCGSRRFSRMGVVGPNKRLEAFGLQSLQGDEDASAVQCSATACQVSSMYLAATSKVGVMVDFGGGIIGFDFSLGAGPSRAGAGNTRIAADRWRPGAFDAARWDPGGTVGWFAAGAGSRSCGAPASRRVDASDPAALDGDNASDPTPRKSWRR